MKITKEEAVEMLKRIHFELKDIAPEDLTKAEKNIMRILSPVVTSYEPDPEYPSGRVLRVVTED